MFNSKCFFSLFLFLFIVLNFFHISFLCMNNATAHVEQQCWNQQQRAGVLAARGARFFGTKCLLRLSCSRIAGPTRLLAARRTRSRRWHCGTVNIWLVRSKRQVERVPQRNTCYKPTTARGRRWLVVRCRQRGGRPGGPYPAGDSHCLGSPTTSHRSWSGQSDITAGLTCLAGL